VTASWVSDLADRDDTRVQQFLFSNPARIGARDL